MVGATGVALLLISAMSRASPYGLVCLTGAFAPWRNLRVDAGLLNRDILLAKDVVFGSVNASAND